MSVEDIIIYILLPLIFWALMRINRIEKKQVAMNDRILMIVYMLRERGCKLPEKGDTEIFRQANNL